MGGAYAHAACRKRRASMNSKQKGNAGERELANELRKYGYDTRRGHQYNGQTDEADVVGIQGLHIECKRVERGLNLEEALKQSIRDAREGETPVVIHRRNHERWKVTMELGEFIALWKK